MTTGAREARIVNLGAVTTTESSTKGYDELSTVSSLDTQKKQVAKSGTSDIIGHIRGLQDYKHYYTDQLAFREEISSRKMKYRITAAVLSVLRNSAILDNMAGMLEHMGQVPNASNPKPRMVVSAFFIRDPIQP